MAHGPSVPRADWRTGRLSSKWLTGRQYPNWLTGRQFPSGCVLVAATGRWSFPRLSPCLTAACRCWLSTGDWRSRPVRVGGFVRVWPKRRPGPSALVWRRPGPATCGRVASSESPARAPIPPLIRGGLVYGPRHILAPRSAPDPSPCLRLKAPFTGYQVGSWGWYRARDRVEASVFYSNIDRRPLSPGNEPGAVCTWPIWPGGGANWP